MSREPNLPVPGAAPCTAIDPWTDKALLDPYPTYAELRALGPVVYLERYNLWAVTHHEHVRQVLSDFRRYTSTRGIGLNDEINNMGQGILSTDPPDHDVMKQVLADQLSPRGIGRIQEQIQRQADELVAAAVSRRAFDAVTDLAEVIGVSIVAELIGIRPQHRGPLLGFAESAFSSWGPPNERTTHHLANMRAFLKYTVVQAGRGNLLPNSWGIAAYEAADRGVITVGTAIELLGAYLGAGMDTTISAISSAILLFARNPEQWAAVRDDRSLLKIAFNEVLRLESPIQMFSRVTTEDVTLGDVGLPAGSRVLAMYGCANRDESRFPQAHSFDVRRRASGHLAFGYGLHTCAGHSFARAEALAVLNALADHVVRFEAGTPIYQINNITRRLGNLPVTVEVAARSS